MRVEPVRRVPENAAFRARVKKEPPPRPTRPNLLGELRRTLGKFYTWSDVRSESLAYGIRNPPHFAWDRKNGAKTLLQIIREKNVTPVMAFTEEWYSAGGAPGTKICREIHARGDQRNGGGFGGAP